MAKINYMDRDNVLREYELGDEAVTFGREAINKVVVADPSVSRQHAWIEKRPDGFYLVDKNSSNGTYVNGKKISQQKLAHNDKINLGSASLVFEDEEQGATFILPKMDVPEITHPDSPVGVNERVTDAFSSPDVRMPEDRPLPPPPPLVNNAPPQAPPQRPSIQTPMQPPAPPAPAPPPPPRPSMAAPAPQPPAPSPPAPQPEAPAPGILCPSCRKVVEAGARFCPFCGTSLGAPKAPPQPQVPAPAPPPPQAAPPRPPMPPPPQAAPVSPRPVAPPPPPAPPSVPMAPPRPAPAPSFGAQPPAAAPLTAPTGALVYAGFGPRFVAVIIDSLLLSALMIPFIIAIFVFMSKMSMSGESPSPLAMIVIAGSYLVITVIGLLYQLIFIGKKGATPGKKFMKLRVTFPDGTYPIGIGKAFLRMIGYMLSGMICYIGFLMVIFDKEQHRALHDKIAGTVVIRES